ncbi:MAG: hypothetical protein US94_C0012G0010 [Berkelbacteria bacterium GW2011_GWB1_38_5]|uniref:Uncharacterized protein n=2 Tax=Candidatus Berkelbacteria TaxID=1618330 RepID=A0A0G0LS15_9BACT|nr:MAG: hypothetical protein US94_C0012G0010 [Berkelbacteria bacterium GW2011_GWB1_38_5]KKQ90760.1 MAG: hypothetical protein UT15_C0005G0010 [Berkelbacteria bacterium GW2011_GWA1_39_10]
MSKKGKSKFHRQIRARILQEMVKTQAQSVSTTEISPAAKPILPPQKTEFTPAPGAGLQVGFGTLQLVRADLKKSAIIIGSIILVIIALAIIDTKTGILLKAGNSIFKTLNIGV